MDILLLWFPSQEHITSKGQKKREEQTMKQILNYSKYADGHQMGGVGGMNETGDGN